MRVNEDMKEISRRVRQIRYGCKLLLLADLTRIKLVVY